MMDTTSADYTTWLAAYKEEYDALRKLATYRIIDKAKVDRLGVTPIPTMNILSVKPDSTGNPLRAKSRTVVLGNEEERCWEKTDVYAPVIGKTSARAFVANGIAMGRITKQADAKNAFCHPSLPEDEICVVTPPKGCPFSKAGEYWLLQKTLYGLRQSPRHWYKALSGALSEIGLKPCPHDPCIYTGKAPNGSTIYVGIYVDDVIYYGTDDNAELWFENELRKHITVDFMGAVSWYLGVYYEWSKTTDGRLSVHLSQESHVHKLLDKEQLVDCNPASTPYRSGTPIDRIPHDGVSPARKPALIKRYQSVLGGCVWLSTNTRPDITACVSLLASHIQNPSEGHLQAARHLLRYLKGSSDWGLRYTSPDPLAVDISESRLRGEVQWPIDEPPFIETRQFVTHTDSNWGPQDASTPKPGELRSEDECRSLAGAITLFMGGPLDWTAIREKRMSRSSCEAEIKAMDEGCKILEFIQHLFRELEVPDGQYPAPLLYNDNKGGVCWALSEAITKKLRHLNIREVAVRDAVRNKDIVLAHIPGVLNLADIFTKEMKDVQHFLQLRAAILSPRVPESSHQISKATNTAKATYVAATTRQSKGYPGAISTINQTATRCSIGGCQNTHD